MVKILATKEAEQFLYEKKYRRKTITMSENINLLESLMRSLYRESIKNKG